MCQLKFYYQGNAQYSQYGLANEFGVISKARVRE